MQVGDTFAPVGPVVDDNPVPLAKLHVSCQLRGDQQQVTEEFLVRLLCFTNPGQGPFRDDQEMDGRLRVDVVNGKGKIILVGDLGRDFPGEDLFKDG